MFSEGDWPGQLFSSAVYTDGEHWRGVKVKCRFQPVFISIPVAAATGAKPLADHFIGAATVEQVHERVRECYTIDRTLHTCMSLDESSILHQSDS